MKTKLLFSLWTIFFTSILSSYAQNFPSCGGTFTDPAGPNANYASNTDSTVTICPDNTGDNVTVTFTAFDVEATWDALYVFNGDSTSATQIASTNGAANVPGGLAGGFWGTTLPGPFTSSNASGCLTFRFRSDNAVNRAGWVANVTCTSPPACPQPFSLALTNVTPSGTTLTWTEAGAATEWQVIALPCGSAPPTANTSGTNVTTNSYSFTSLSSSTCYNTYVRAMCNATEVSDWSGPLTFTTLMEPVVCGGLFVDNGGSNANYLNSSDVTTTICPNNPGDLVTVTFTAFNTEATWDALYVYNGNSIAASQITSTNPAGNVPGGLPGGFWGTAIPGPFTSSSQDGCLTFRFRSDNTVNRPGWIANVTCAPPPTCPRPTALTISGITNTSLTVGWNEIGSATNWDIIVLPTGSPAPNANSTGFIATTVNPFVITGLSPNTCYTIYARAVCSASDLSDWSVGVSACTQPLPPICGGQFVDNGGPNANYANSSDNTYTICPTIPGELVTVVFTSFDTEATWDALYVFDGNSINAPQIPSSNAAANVPGGLPGGYWGTTIPGPFTSSSPDGCLTFRFRSDNTVNRPGWIANVTCAPDADKIVLVAFVDDNNNGIRDTGETLFPNGSFIYQQNDSGTNISGYSPTGQYALYDTNPNNTYDFSYELLPEYTTYYATTGITYNDMSIAVGSGTQFLYFPVTLTQTYADLSISIAPLSPPRPALTYQNRIIYKNIGLAASDGTVTFVKPSQVTINTVSQAGVVNNANGFTYNFTNLQPNETRIITVTMTVPPSPTVNLNDLLTATATITAIASDINLVNNTNTNSQIVVNSWDPNDKMEAHGDKIRINEFTADDYLYYTIRFQNNGTASAIDVHIEDLLDSQLNEESVRMVSASHNYTMTRNGNHLEWEFKNIYLPSSLVNVNGSMGFVQFKIKANPGFQVGDIIPNNASIIFDSNPAIVTNTFNTKFLNALSNTTFADGNLVLYPNPATNNVQISLTNTTETIDTIVLYNLLGKTVKTVQAQSNELINLNVSDLSKGVYLVEINTENHLKTIKKLVIQ
ncbi:T9SS type A sorting domain-containing protein [Flavobacterium sp. IMCC34852]|uniref:T9SS type A sorting domain-containing protein n=1 Tax=Flavobacterium rivulicola TaxID=2732161 RepID=A0A7Y3VXK0_9FLAO|nr:T9SS type A sorting domain-containing protein [Flavobacterium sp. IMCC34852]NNT70710.1 T9SS type A sorting domain-containing protein [Flavobacterium sp. IMCC34852]